MDKFKALLASRKFWALVASLATIVGGVLSKGSDHMAIPDAVHFVVIALAAYKVGTGLDSAKALPAGVVTVDALEKAAVAQVKP